MKNFINPFDQNFTEYTEQKEQHTQTKTEKRAAKIFEHKSYASEYKTVYIFSILLKYTANCISFLTAFFALNFALEFILNSTLSFALSLVFCCIVEVFKNSLWAKGFKNFAIYNKIHFVSVALLVSLHIFSILSSGFGSWIMLDYTEKSTKDIVFNAQDSVLLGQIEQTKTQLANEQKVKSNLSENLQSSTNKRTLAAMQASSTAQKLDSLQNVLSLNFEEKRQKLEDEKQSEKQKNEVVRYALLFFSVLFELVFIACVLFEFRYLHRVYLDTPQNAQKAVLNGLKPQNDQQDQNQAQVPQNGQRIGFKTYTDQSTGIKYVLHNNKKYTESSIKQNISSFKSKLEKYEGTDKEQRYREHLQRWENYLKQVR